MEQEVDKNTNKGVKKHAKLKRRREASQHVSKHKKLKINSKNSKMSSKNSKLQKLSSARLAAYGVS